MKKQRWTNQQKKFYKAKNFVALSNLKVVKGSISFEIEGGNLVKYSNHDNTFKVPQTVTVQNLKTNKVLKLSYSEYVSPVCACGCGMEVKRFGDYCFFDEYQKKFME